MPSSTSGRSSSVTTDRLAIALVALGQIVSGDVRASPQIIVSLKGATLRIVEEGHPDLIFPVGVGRDVPDGRSAPAVMYTGPDPGDRSFYLPARREPAFHLGLPYLRLDRRTGQIAGIPARPFSIHGPVTPTLIWGRVSAGCVRMRPPDLKQVYRLAVRHPGMKVSFIPGPDGRGELERPPGAKRLACPEAAIGLRRLRPIAQSRVQHDRICGGVDHWYSVELRGGDTVAVRLQHGGALRAELYGMRAISTVAEGRFGFEHRVPDAQRFRGARYLRISSAASRELIPYALSVTVR